jgi:hypothetical protein
MTENLSAPVTPEYPKTPRRAWVDLSEAVRQLNDGEESYVSIAVALEAGERVHKAIAELPMSEDERLTVRETFHSAVRAEKTRESIATDIADLLTGREGFHAERFIHHAASKLETDEGKWSYNLAHSDETDA